MEESIVAINSVGSSKQTGIRRQLTVAGNPEQNGVGERINRTLREKVRALLKESGLDNRYWGEALKFAVYIRNVTPSKAVQGMVPYQAWTGENPDLIGYIVKSNALTGPNSRTDKSVQVHRETRSTQ